MDTRPNAVILPHWVTNGEKCDKRRSGTGVPTVVVQHNLRLPKCRRAAPSPIGPSNNFNASRAARGHKGTPQYGSAGGSLDNRPTRSVCNRLPPSRKRNTGKTKASPA